MASTIEQERAHHRAEVAAAVAEDDDPLPAYTAFVHWMIERTPQDKQGLIALLKEVTDKFRDDDAYRNSRPYLQLWCLYAARVDRPAAVYAYLLKKRIGVAWAQLYEEYGAALEKAGDRTKADAVFRSGIARKARPAKGLQEAYDKFLSRGPPTSASASASAPSLASTKSTSSSAADSGSDAAKHKRYAYIRTHLKGSGAPAPGKRAERFAYDFRKLFTTEGVEYSAEEARARSLGLLGKKWATLSAEPPFGTVPQVAVRHADADVSLDDSPARVPVRFENGPRNPGFSSGMAVMGAEPTVTINTKEALADVLGMYNSPDRTARFVGKAIGSKHAPLKKVEPIKALAPGPMTRTLSDENAGGGRAAFKPFSENDQNHPPRARFAQHSIPEEGEQMEPPEPVSGRNTPFRPFMDEDEPEAAPSGNKTPSLRPFVDQAIDDGEDVPLGSAIPQSTYDEYQVSKTPKASSAELPTQTPSFKPFVDENAGPATARKERDTRTPAFKSKPSSESDRSNRTPFGAISRMPFTDNTMNEDAEAENEIEADAEDQASPTENPPAVFRAAPARPTEADPPISAGVGGMVFSKPGSSVFSNPRARTPSAADQPPVSTSGGNDVFFAPGENGTRARTTSSASTVSANGTSGTKHEASTAMTSGPSVFRKASGTAPPMVFGNGGSSVFRAPNGKIAPSPAFKPMRGRSQQDDNSGQPNPPPSRLPLQSRPIPPPPPPQELPEAEFDQHDDTGVEPIEDEEDASYGQDYARQPQGGRCGPVNVMTPIIERTMEYTSTTMLRLGTATPSWHPNNGQLNSAARRISERNAMNAAERLVEELAEDEDVPEDKVLVFSSKLPDEPSPPGSITPPSHVATPDVAHPPTFAAHVSKEEEVAPEPCNPFDPAIMQRLLKPIAGMEGYHDLKHQEAGLLAKIRKFTSGRSEGGRISITLGDRHYFVSEKLGEGGFGAVFAARIRQNPPAGDDSDEDDEEEDEDDPALAVAVKVVKPRILWEFLAIRQIHDVLPETLRHSVVFPYDLFAYRDESFLVLELCPQGTLLDVVNQANAMGLSRPTSPLDEVLVMFFVIEILRLVEGLHQAGFIHGDLKIDNCLVRLDDVPSGMTWSHHYSASGADGWAYKGVKLIDFGRTIDTRQFPVGQEFIGDWDADDRDCMEMREGRPWSYQTDYFGLAGIIYCLFYGKYIEGSSIVCNSEGRYQLASPLKRYWQGEIWNPLFDVLLNPTTVHEDGTLPLCDVLSALREDMEDWLTKNCERPGSSLKGNLKRIERGV